MKLRILSDLHLEGDRSFKYTQLDEDVLILAGDISSRLELYQEFIKDITIPIIAIPGNHEFYGHEFTSHLSKLQDAGYLYNQVKEINGVYFICGTGWTSFELHGAINRGREALQATEYINDFTKINKKDSSIGSVYYRLWCTRDCYAEHIKFTNFLDHTLETLKDKKTVIVSHFLPLEKCIHEKFKDSPVNSYYASDLSSYMNKFKGLWVHGHTHTSLDFHYGNMRVICNPKGYGKENADSFNKDLIVEI